MSYSTYTSILTIVPGLAQTTTAKGYSTTVSVVEKHIGRADSMIDGKIAKRYSLPFLASPPLLITISEDITAYMTYKSFYRQDNLNRLDDLEESKNFAYELLGEIQSGAIDLVNTAGSVISESSAESGDAPDSTTKNYQSAFDVDDVLDWEIDPDLLDSVSDERK